VAPARGAERLAQPLQRWRDLIEREREAARRSSGAVWWLMPNAQTAMKRDYKICTTARTP